MKKHRKYMIKKDEKKETKNTSEVKEEVKQDTVDVENKKEEEVEEVVEDINTTDPKDEEIDKLKAEVARLKNAYALAYADTENQKKRLDAEAATAKKYRIQSFASDILPSIDNLERALQAFENKEDQFYKGVEMIYNAIKDALKKEGVEEVECLNKEFDPKFEQAIMVEKKEGVKPNTVIEVLQKGYMLKDRVLRAAMVKVSE